MHDFSICNIKTPEFTLKLLFSTFKFILPLLGSGLAGIFVERTVTAGDVHFPHNAELTPRLVWRLYAWPRLGPEKPVNITVFFESGFHVQVL